MDDLKTFFDSFYDRFVLRDFFGKVIPGSILLFSVTLSLSSFPVVLFYLNNLNIYLWIFLVGVGWITGFTIQSFGDRLKLVRYFSGDIKQENERKHNYKTQQDFYDSEPSAPIRQTYERLIVIKEACGNSYVSLIISLIIFIIAFIVSFKDNCQYNLTDCFQLGLIFILFIWAILNLKYFHDEHNKRQETWLEVYMESLQLNKPLQTSSTTTVSSQGGKNP